MAESEQPQNDQFQKYLEDFEKRQQARDASMAEIQRNQQAIAQHLAQQTQAVQAPKIAPVEQSTIAIFGYDANEDGQSSLESSPLFQSFPFLAGVDVSVSAGSGEVIEVVFNGKSYRASARASETEGPLVFVLE